jgi:hypothetical protein
MPTTIGTVTAFINAGPGVPGTLNVETEQIDITTATETKPDATWEYIDPAGHFHAFDRTGELPTLTSRSEHVACSGVHTYPIFDEENCEGYEVMVYECAICGAKVEPAWITTPTIFRKFMPGRTCWTVEVEQPVTEDRVSVRLVVGETEMFGIAARGGVRAEGDRNGERVWTTLHGASALGNRQRRGAEASTP